MFKFLKIGDENFKKNVEKKYYFREKIKTQNQMSHDEIPALPACICLGKSHSSPNIHVFIYKIRVITKPT